ncbi:hypothetical protein BOTNAR_0077g00350 [Botryotinia narcissicola]|uniref:Methyltransferase type 11 domain-containing protein n=1 Tax=Botryotinia narcissicola TaxID=278944 RepID=A0A4Z1IW33_9HELO|nr:hypothetical protein BOTNAR_0077g00350 [Botryotinia narcissicola]
MFGFDIVVTETTAVELEVDPAVADTYFSDSEEEYGPETTRTFHEDKDKKYKLPIDKFEQDRLDLQHQMLKVMMDGKIHLQPLNPEEVKHVLDTPENCKFVVADAEEAWEFPHKFDFVHMRDLMMCFSDQKEVFRSAYNALEPGGYFQILDAKLPLASIDDSMESSGIARWFEACIDAGEADSRPWTNIPKYMEWLEDIGFEEVTETVYHNPINDWAIGAKEKQIGAMMQKDIKRWLYSTTRTVVEGSNMNEEEVKELLLKAKESGRNRNIHAYIPIYVVWGRKPFPSES